MRKPLRQRKRGKKYKKEKAKIYFCPYPAQEAGKADVGIDSRKDVKKYDVDTEHKLLIVAY
jgi:hypothetical protein